MERRAYRAWRVLLTDAPALAGLTMEDVTALRAADAELARARGIAKAARQLLAALPSESKALPQARSLRAALRGGSYAAHDGVRGAAG